MKYKELDLGTIEAVVDKLGGMDGVRSFLVEKSVLKTISIVLPTVKTFNPATFTGRSLKVLDGENDKRAEALIEVDFAKVIFDTCLKDGETRITGEEKLKRLKESGNIRLGAETFLALWNEDGRKTLEWLHKEKGITYLDFFGSILESSNGGRCVLCLHCYDGRWGWNYSWLGNDWDGAATSLSLL